MTLREHYLHNNSMKTNEIKNQKIIKSTEASIDKVDLFLTNLAKNPIPQSLLIFLAKKNEIKEMMTKLISVADSITTMMNNEPQTAYNEGAKRAMSFCIEEIDEIDSDINKFNELSNKYRALNGSFKELLSVMMPSELDKIYNEGICFGFLKAAEMIDVCNLSN